MKKKPTLKKPINKSTKYYLICGGASVLFILILLYLYALITKLDILAWLTSRYAFFIYGAIIIYLTIGIILIVKDKIKEM